MSSNIAVNTDVLAARYRVPMVRRLLLRYGASARRFALVVLGLMVLAGCAVSSKPFTPPIDKVLQEPLPGQAIAYLLRAPHDDADIEISVGNKKVALLPAGTYTAISLMPGSHAITTRRVSTFGSNAEVAPVFSLTVQPGERRFLNISGVMARTLGIYGGIPISEIGVASGSRSWKEVREIDAQGLMSISRVVLPEKGAL